MAVEDPAMFIFQMKPETGLLFPTNTSEYIQSLFQSPRGVGVQTCVVTGLQGTSLTSGGLSLHLP